MDDPTPSTGTPRQELAERLLYTAALLHDITVHSWAFRRDRLDQYPEIQTLSTRNDDLKLVVSSTGKLDLSHPIVGAFVAAAWRFKREQAQHAAVRRKYAHLYDQGYTTYDRATAVRRVKRGELNFAMSNDNDPNIKTVGAWYDIDGRRCHEDRRAVYYIANTTDRWSDKVADQFALLAFGTRPRMLVHREEIQ